MTIQAERQQDSIYGNYRKLTRSKLVILLMLSLALVITCTYALMSGTVPIPFEEILTAILPSLTTNTDFQINDYIIRQVRLPRIMAALLTGMALAVGGTIMQAVLRNPLASPFTLGVSSGASFGAALAIVLGTSVFGSTLVASGQVLIALNAFIFGCLSLSIVYVIAQMKQGSTTVLLLAGVAISSIFGAGVSALSYFSDNEALRDLTVWLLGGFWGVDWHEIFILVPTFIVAFVILMRYAWDLNAIISGDDVAETMGVPVRRVQFITLVTVTLVASAAIAFSGIIGFVGLVAPHIIRSFVGVDNQYLLPGAALTGAVLLLLADTVARTIIAPIEIPVGIIMSLVGGPFFIYILLVRDRSIWD
jgi:iron complex transport system permease protein